MHGYLLIDFEGLPALQLRAGDGAAATILLQGAQVVGWRCSNGVERLYLSEKAVFARGEAVRGGIPVVFPQFDTLGPLPRHGFAREQTWHPVSVQAESEATIAVLRLEDTEASRSLWPYRFGTELRVRVGGARLDLEFSVVNRGSAPFSFAAALHSYLAVSQLEEVRLEGLEACPYLDRSSGHDAIADIEPLAIDREINRIYRHARARLQQAAARMSMLLEEPARALRIEQHNFPNVVVWNPWEIKAARIPDLPQTGFQRFLCVEAAAIDPPIRLQSGDSWSGRQTLEVLR